MRFFTTNVGRQSSTVAILICLTIQISYSQQDLNLDFEKLSVEGVARPWGWAIYSYAPEVSMICDSTVHYEGNYSLRISNESTSTGQKFELAFFIEPSQILGSDILLQGWSKSAALVGKAAVGLKSEGALEEGFGTLNEDLTSISASEDWLEFTADINVNDQSHSVIVSLYFEGQGVIWFDKLELLVNYRKVTEVPVAPAFSEKQVSSLRQEMSALKTVEPLSNVTMGPSDFEDLEFFESMVADAQIIALGESTHGTSEFFKVKHRLLQYAIMEIGARVFVLEDNQLNVERVNDFVTKGKGTAVESLQGLFAVWNAKEMLQMVEWLHAYNRTHPEAMVEFVGMDVQNPQLAFDLLSDFLLRQDPLIQQKSNQFLTNIRENWRNRYVSSDSTIKEWDHSANQNYELISEQKETWLSVAADHSDSTKIMWAIQYAKLIKQFTETARTGIYEGRDKAMAENVTWILNQREPGTKMVVWAHDSHISRGDGKKASDNYFLGNSMGSYLSKKYLDKYRAFGLSTYEGTCLGTISYRNFKQIPFEIYTSPVGSLDEGLHRLAQDVKANALMLDLNRFREDPLSFQWLNKKRPARYVGYVAEDYGFGGRYVIPYQFDGIIFIDQSHAATVID